MKVIVDLSRCAVHGDCVIEAPEVFDIGDDDEVVTVLNDSPSEELRGKVERAVASCPVAALRCEG